MIDKISITAALICLASITTAQTVTLGTFGYTRVEKPAAKLNLVGNGFEDKTLTEIAPVEFYNGGIDSAVSDKIYVWDPSVGYIAYALFDGSAYAQPVEWRLASAFFGSAVNPVISAGSGFWIQSSGSTVDTNVVISGNVITDQVVTNAIATGFQIMAYPFSSMVDLNSTELKNSGSGDVDSAVSDKVIVWNMATQTYVTYALFDGTAYAQPLEWRLASDFFTPAGAIPLNLGDGFWYDAKSAFSWVETNQYYNNL